MQHVLQPLRPAAVHSGRRALVAILTTLVAAAACDQQPDTLPTSPSIPGRSVPRPAVVGASVTVLPTLGGATTMAAALNDAGQVVGWSNTSAGRTHAFLWTPDGGMLDLGTLGGFHSFAVGINNAGHVAGYSEVQGSLAQHAFLWTPEQGMQDLGVLAGGTASSARAFS